MKINLILVMVLSTLSILVISTLLDSGYGQKEDSIDHVPKFFAIQHAQSGSLSEINETTYSLELNDVSDKTILFTDRPDRIVKSISTSNFIGNWSKGEDSFAADAPNAVLVVDKQEGKNQEMVIVELFNPVTDVDNKALKYNIIQDSPVFIDLSDFGQSTLIIDPDTVAPMITD